MKQKQVKASPKVEKKTKVSKPEPPKKAQTVVEESDEEEVVQEKVEVKKTNKKKAAKGKIVVELEPEQEEEVESDDEDAVQEKVVAKQPKSKAAKGKQVVEEPEDEQQDEDEDEEEEENEDDDNDEEDNEEEGDDACAPPSEVLVGPFKVDYPPKQCVHVTELPIKCKQIDIVEAFAKYGAIKQIHIVTTPSGSSANIAFKTAKAAAAAVADDKKLKVGNSVVSVVQKEAKPKKGFMRERSIAVKNIKKGTTKEHLRELFESCGEIESVKVVETTPIHAFVTFADKAAVAEAMKLHNTVLNDANIQLFENSKNREDRKSYDENLAIMLRNKQELTSIDASKLRTIFSKCGEIDFMDVICRKNILAFIVFKTEEAVQKALEMSGKTEQEIILEIEPYGHLTKKWTSIHVVNIPKGSTEEDLKTHFAKAGEIANVVLKGSFAIIRFEDSDGYCKSFLYNESFLKGHMIFIEPHSPRKAQLLRKNFGKNRGFKRPFENGKNKGPKRSFENGHSAFKTKKPKLN